MGTLTNRGLRTAGVVAVLGSFAVLAGCGGASTSTGADGGSGTFNYLVVLPLSGPLAAIGEADKAAVEAGIDVVNANGGADGKTMKATFIDSTGTSTQAVSVLQKALTSGAAYSFVHAGATSTEAVPMLPLLTKEKVPSCTSASATPLDDPKQYPYAFGTSALSNKVAAAAMSSLKESGYQSGAGLYPSTELGQAAKQAAGDAAGSAGITYSTVDVDPASTDVTPQLTAAKAKSPAALVVDGFGPVASVMLKSRASMGWNVPVIGDDTFAVNDLSGLSSGTTLDGVKLSTQKLNVSGTDVTTSADFQTYASALAKYVPNPTFAVEVYGDNYMCPLLAAAAADKAKSTDPDKLKAALETMRSASDVKGWFLTGSIGFSSQTHFPDYQPSDYVTVNAGPRVKGLLVPNK